MGKLKFPQNSTRLFSLHREMQKFGKRTSTLVINELSMTLYANLAERPVANLTLLAISISINNYICYYQRLKMFYDTCYPEMRKRKKKILIFTKIAYSAPTPFKIDIRDFNIYKISFKTRFACKGKDQNVLCINTMGNDCMVMRFLVTC